MGNEAQGLMEAVYKRGEKDALEKLLDAHKHITQLERQLADARRACDERNEGFRQQLVCAALTGLLSNPNGGGSPFERAIDAHEFAEATFDEYQRRAKERK